MNKSLADKLKAIRVYSNQYKLAEYSCDSVPIEACRGFKIPMIFAEEELADPRVRIMHGISAFDITFTEKTPFRTFSAVEIDGR